MKKSAFYNKSTHRDFLAILLLFFFFLFLFEKTPNPLFHFIQALVDSLVYPVIYTVGRIPFRRSLGIDDLCGCPAPYDTQEKQNLKFVHNF